MHLIDVKIYPITGSRKVVLLDFNTLALIKFKLKNMKKILLSILIGILFFSCSKDDAQSEVQGHAASSKEKLFIKNTDRQIVSELPLEVYDKVISDFKKQNHIEKIDRLNATYKKEGNLVKLISNMNLTGKTVALSSSVSFQYMAHIAFDGWTAWTNLGSDAGLTGVSKRLEALQFSCSTYLPDFTAQAYVQQIGWMAPVGLGQVVGTVGQSKRAEAFKVNVPTSFATNVYYQVHAEKLGWMPLVGNGEMAGTIDQSRRVESFRMYMIII